MIEEELAPVYTNAPEETPSPELPQMPIAGGVEDDFAGSWRFQRVHFGHEYYCSGILSLSLLLGLLIRLFPRGKERNNLSHFRHFSALELENN